MIQEDKVIIALGQPLDRHRHLIRNVASQSENCDSNHRRRLSSSSTTSIRLLSFFIGWAGGPWWGYVVDSTPRLPLLGLRGPARPQLTYPRSRWFRPSLTRVNSLLDAGGTPAIPVSLLPASGFLQFLERAFMLFQLLPGFAQLAFSRQSLVILKFLNGPMTSCVAFGVVAGGLEWFSAAFVSSCCGSA